MANETTSGTWSNAALAYALREGVLEANLPRPVVLGLCNDDDIDGMPSDTVNYPVETDIGAASAGTEGTEITTNTALALDTSITCTVVEGALISSNITKQAISQIFPGFRGVNDFVQRATHDQMVQLLSGPVRRHAAACIEKAETDAAALLAGFSNSVGGGAAVDITLLNCLEADYTLETLEPRTDERAFVLAPHQYKELRAEMLSTSGGVGGTLWTSQADASMVNSGPTGMRGSLLGRDVYVMSHSVRYENSNIAYGALMCVGRGNPIDGQLGAITIARRGFVNPEVQYEARKRGFDLVTAFEYVVKEVRDTHGVAIATDDA